MIEVTRLNGKDFVLNAELIEVMEETPDTVKALHLIVGGRSKNLELLHSEVWH